MATRLINRAAVAAPMQSHGVVVQRRSGGTFAPITSGAAVQPGEAIRLYASGISSALIHSPEFVITGTGGEILRRETSLNSLGGDAWIDTVAPMAEGTYTVTVDAQSFPFLPFTHEESTTFVVSASAPPPPSAPPRTGLGKFLPDTGDLKFFAVIGLAIVAAIVVLPRFVGKKE